MRLSIEWGPVVGFLGCGNITYNIIISEEFIDNVAEGHIC
jgi:hypothetical protein